MIYTKSFFLLNTKPHLEFYNNFEIKSFSRLTCILRLWQSFLRYAYLTFLLQKADTKRIRVSNFQVYITKKKFWSMSLCKSSKKRRIFIRIQSAVKFLI